MIVYQIPRVPSEQPLFYTQKVHPNQNRVSFFIGENALPGNFTGSLSYPESFKIKRISCLASLETRIQDFYRIMNSAIFEFKIGGIKKLEIPASLVCWGNIKEIDILLKSLEKSPKIQQETIIRNLRVAEGFVLKNPIELICQEYVEANLIFHKPLKNEITITCVLGGEYLKSLTC